MNKLKLFLNNGNRKFIRKLTFTVDSYIILSIVEHKIELSRINLASHGEENGKFHWDRLF